MYFHLSIKVVNYKLNKTSICTEKIQACRCKQTTIYSNHIPAEALQLIFSIAAIISLTKGLDDDYKIMNSVTHLQSTGHFVGQLGEKLLVETRIVEESC